VNPIDLIFAGGGTVGCGVLEEVAASPAAEAVASVTAADRAPIRPENAVTCPHYAGHVGRAKAERLAELAREWLPGRPARSVVSAVEDLDWSRLLGASPDARDVVVVGLDDWNARLAVAEDLRASDREVLVAQVGLERGSAQVFVTGNDPRDPCPACGLLVLPGSEPCVAYGAEGDLVRGDLRREVAAAGEVVAEVIADLARNGESGSRRSGKTYLFLDGNGGVRRRTRRAAMRDGCPGPHAGAPPVRWDHLAALGGRREGETVRRTS
jgi:molybdopterin/thiamine biosynthesis adenylyltransferase